jgi:uncharacterized protein YbjT (DUF2867 family)
MEIAVTTPNGHVGHHVVRHLVRAGIRPRVLAHHPETLGPAVREHVDARAVDLGEPDQVAAQTRDVDACFVVIPSLGGPDPVAEYGRIGTGVAEALAANRVPRTVLQSSVGAELRHGAGEIDGLAGVEEALDTTLVGRGLAVLHLRCGYFFSNLLLQLDALRSGTVPIVLPTDQPMPWVAPQDIASVASSWLLRSDWDGRQVRAVHGPADLSWDDAMRIVTEATALDVTAERIPDQAMRDQLAGVGMSPGLVEAIMGMSTGLRDGFVPEQPRDLTTTTDTTLASWAHEVLRPALGA